MADATGDRQKPPRTMLEAKIRERSMTYEEFAEYATTYARDHGEPGTLSTRQLQRLLSSRPDGVPARPRPATRRLLERIFNAPADDLLAAPAEHAENAAVLDEWHHQIAEFDRNVAAAQRVDREVLDLFASQIDTTRRLDRRFGAVDLLDPLRLHIGTVENLFNHATTDTSIHGLAALLTEAHTLAAWQSLDRAQLAGAWRHSRRACDTARAADSSALLAHALAEQAVILTEAGHTAASARLSAHARATGAHGSALLRAWLAAAHGEALAARGRRDASLRAFDDAAHILPHHAIVNGREPYIALDISHLARWRGHALARFAHPDAVPVLRDALTVHDAEFTRAEAALRTDLAAAHLASGEPDAARRHHARARSVAEAVGSARQLRRLDALPLG